MLHEIAHLLGYSHLREVGESTGEPAPLGTTIAEVAFKPYTHVEIAKDVRDDIIADGRLTIGGHAEGAVQAQYDVHPAIVAAITDYPGYYFAGTVGPDGFPDLVMGQSVVHPIDTGTWLARVLDMAWAAQTDAAFSPVERSQILAWSYGYATHAAGDFWAHTLVNEFAQGVFPAVGDVVQDDRDLANAVRHLLLEGYIGDATPGFDNHPDRSLLPDGDVSDDSTPGIVFGAPVRFIYDTLIRAFPGDPTAEGSTRVQTLDTDAATHEIRRAVGSGDFLADGFAPLDAGGAAMRVQAFGFGPGDPWYTIVAVTAGAITVLEPIADSTGDGDEWLSTSVSRGVLQDTFFNLLDSVSLALVAAGGAPAASFDTLTDQVVAILAGGGVPSPVLVDQLYRAYLAGWAADIRSGLENWGILGLASTNALFDADARRHLQNATAADTGADVDPARADAEGVGLLDVLIAELDDPNRDDDTSDSFIDNYLMPMLGSPRRLVELTGVLGTFAEALDDTILGALGIVANPLRATIAELAQIPKQWLTDYIETRFGVPLDLLEQLNGMSNKLDLASVTVGSTVIPVYQPTDHAKLDGYLGIQGAAHASPIFLDHGPGFTFYPNPTGVLDANVEFDKGTFAAYRNSVMLAKLLLLNDKPLGGAGASPSDGGLSRLMSDQLALAVPGSLPYDWSLLNSVGAHGGNIFTTTLPMDGLGDPEIRGYGRFPGSELLVAGRPLDDTPWLRLIDGDHNWRADSRTIASTAYRLSIPDAVAPTAEWQLDGSHGG